MLCYTYIDRLVGIDTFKTKYKKTGVSGPKLSVSFDNDMIYDMIYLTAIG